MAELETLRAAFRGSLVGDLDGHLTDDQWEALACDELDDDERRAAVDHILECPLCSETYRAIEILRSEAPRFDAAAPAPMVRPGDVSVRKFPYRALGLLAVAATVLLAVVLPVRFDREPVIDDGAMVVRSAGDDAGVTPVAPVGAVAWSMSEDVLFQWTATATEPSVSAFVEILDIDGELIWTGPEVESNEVVWPGQEIPGPGRYYWRVVISDASGQVADSELASFDLEL